MMSLRVLVQRCTFSCAVAVLVRGRALSCAGCGLMSARARSRSIALLGPEQRVGEVHHVFEPERLEMQFSAKLGQLSWDAVVERVVRRDDGHGGVPATLPLPQPIEKPEAIDQRHP